MSEGGSRVADALAEARSSGEPDRLFALIPYARFLGLRGRMTEAGPELTMPFAERLVGDSSIPALHGGTTGALLESAAVLTALFASETGALPKTVSLTVDYLRSGRAEDTHARAELIKQGRRIVIVRALAWQSDTDKPIAQAKVCFRMREPRP